MASVAEKMKMKPMSLPLWQLVMMSLVLSLLEVACFSSRQKTDSEPCPPGQELDSITSSLCRPILPPHECPPGTMPVSGMADCQPVGWTDCPAGFTVAASGWGCVGILPDESCTGTSIASLGSSQCVPIGDCDAPFPPAAATLLVDASLEHDEPALSRYRSINAALAASLAGDVIAIAPGVYQEQLYIRRTVSLVGGCAELVVIEGSGAGVGIEVSGTASVSVSGVTLSAHGYGVLVERGAAVTLSDSLVVDQRRIGVAVFDAGSRLVVERTAVRSSLSPAAHIDAWGAVSEDRAELVLRSVELSDNLDAALIVLNSGSVHVEASVIQNTRAKADGSGGMGVKGFSGSRLSFERTMLRGNRSMSILVGPGPGSTDLILRQSAIATTQLDTREGTGWGLAGQAGASIQLEDVTLDGNAGVGVSLKDENTSLVATRFVIHGTTPGSGPFLGLGLFVGTGAQAELDSAALVANHGVGVGVSRSPSSLRLHKSLVAHTHSVPQNSSTLQGMGGGGLAVVAGAYLELAASAVTATRESAVAATDDGSRLVIQGGVVRVVAPNGRGVAGDAILVRSGASGLINSVVIKGAVRAGLLFSAAHGTVSASWVLNNAVGINVQEATLEELDELQELSRGRVQVRQDTIFGGNEVSIGSDSLPLPSSLPFAL